MSFYLDLCYLLLYFVLYWGFNLIKRITLIKHRCNDEERYSMPQDIPCCSGCCGHLVGYIRRVHIHSPSRSSSGWGHTGHSCGQWCLACRGIGQSVYHSDTLHQYSSHLQCLQLHKYSLQDETECRIIHRCINSLPLFIVNAIRFCTYTYSPERVRFHNNLVYTQNKSGRLCYTGTWGIGRFVGHMTLGPGGQCSRCNGTAGMSRQAAQDPHCTQGRSDHSEDLKGHCQ